MGEKLTVEEGEFLVRLARKAIVHYLESGKKIEEKPLTQRLEEKRGVFVTLKKYPSDELRGCIGFPEPIKPLVEATVEAAISAATGDPRFPPMRDLSEMEKIKVEVSVLTPPKKLEVDNPKEYVEKIEIGRHGIIVRRGARSGLLLPQVPVEEGWDEIEFLSHACLKAGLPPDWWCSSDCEIYVFEAQVFEEEKPEGPVRERDLAEEQ
ncbi:TIGR00296 family protein [Methanopyrus sp. SNP6]|uniref:TIGR00296 family protein n=1 Tax=Methanopyrus sp. SNP6 TaxID=1937005 RepID=UPI0011E5B9C3|nr:TIGR00296 family protein [Methanopyrus sp. SNP6]